MSLVPARVFVWLMLVPLALAYWLRLRRQPRLSPLTNYQLPITALYVIRPINHYLS